MKTLSAMLPWMWLERTTVRRVEPEFLDELPAANPEAIRARRDLRRINAWMGNARILQGLLTSLAPGKPPKTMAELGGGDGTLMLKLAQRLSPKWRGVTLQLIDRQDLLSVETAAAFARLGWRVQSIRSDVEEWLERTSPVDFMVANLFLHHFDTPRLRQVLELVAGRTQALVACEPRRFSFPGLAGRLVFFIGCTRLTRHDSVTSIRAGFIGQELSAVWPERTGWTLQERESGLFSHSFCAFRR